MYELMIMAVKHQIQTIRNPRHLVMITLNHLDAMQDYTNNADLQKSIYLAYEHLINVSNGLGQILQEIETANAIFWMYLDGTA